MKTNFLSTNQPIYKKNLYPLFPIVLRMVFKNLLAVVLAFSALSPAHGFSHFGPHEQELIYDWHTYVKASTIFPITHASLFLLHGKVHLQVFPNSTHVQLTDLRYKMYNGLLDHDHHHPKENVCEVPVHMKGLGDIFQVMHDQNGFVTGVVTNEMEHEYVKNMKKAIGSVLQVHRRVLEPPNWHHNKVYSFVKVEPSIYGQFENNYVVRNHEDGSIHIKKMHDTKSSKHLYENFWGMHNTVPCGAIHSELNHLSTKEYFVEKNQDRHIVKHIEAVGTVTYQPFDGKSNQYYVMVNQTWSLDTMMPIQNRFQGHDGKIEDLAYHHAVDNHDGSVNDITNGLRVINFDKMVPKMQTLLSHLAEDVRSDHLNTSDINIEKSQAMNMLRRHLAVSSKENLIKFQDMLSGTHLKIFHGMLPLVGTKGSVSTIKDLIVNKQVPDDAAVEMLQHLVDNVMTVDQEMLTELEVFITLDEKIAWKVRKVAIITFGTLVHKAHQHWKVITQQKDESQFHHQKSFDKYVETYISQLEMTPDFDHQTAYLLGLSNMKMHVTPNYLLPKIYNEWAENRHLRFQGVLALATSLLVHPINEYVMKIFWPIFVDTKEDVNIRVIAFRYFMERRPSAGKLAILAQHMAQEPNNEIRSFVYTYLEDIAKTAYECDSDFKIEVKKIIKLIDPPSYGVSFTKIYSYNDANFDFGASVTSHFVAYNRTMSFGLIMQSNKNHWAHYDYAFNILIDGIQFKGDPYKLIVNLLKSKHNPTISKNIQIQVSVFRSGYAIDSYFFNEHNLHHLDHVLNLFTQGSHSIEQNTYKMGYEDSKLAVIPSDLGVPIMWTHNIPYFSHNYLKIVKETVNKVTKIHFEYRYQNTINPIDELKIYNPFADVWHGAGRVHTFDLVIPINFDINVNLQQQIVKLSWKKQNDPKWDVAGFKNHIKNVVYAIDDNNSGVLKQISPQSEPVVVITDGKKYEHEIVMHQDSSLSTGIQWNVVIFDTNKHITNSTANTQLQSFLHGDDQTTANPLRLLTLYILNYYGFIVNYPLPGNGALLVKLEPNQEHHVTGIDLSLRLHSEISEEKKHHYTKKSKWSGRATYRVNSGETNLKTWDINALLDLNDGHTVNSLKMFATRIVPEQQDYKICVDGVKKWGPSGVTGQIKVAMGQAENEKCVKNGGIVDLTMSGQKSEEQQQGMTNYQGCQHIDYYFMPHTHSLECLVDHSTIRHYSYKIKTENMPVEFKKTIMQWWDVVKSEYLPYYQLEDEHDGHVEDGTMTIDVEYPMEDSKMDVTITTPQHVHELSGIPTKPWKVWGMQPDSMAYPAWFQWMYQINMVDHCVINMDYHIFNDVAVNGTVPTEWTLYVGDKENNPTIGVFVKRITENMIGVKIVDHGHTIEIVPHGMTRQISLDGKVVPIDIYHREDWVFVRICVKDDLYHPAVVMMQNSGLHVDYRPEGIMVIVPKVDGELQGHCYTHH